jgi:hypothetical protein
MTPAVKMFRDLLVEFSWLWLLHLAYLFRLRSRLAAAVVSGFKFVAAKTKYPDTVMRDWLIYMDLIAAFFFVILVWGAAIE